MTGVNATVATWVKMTHPVNRRKTESQGTVTDYADELEDVVEEMSAYLKVAIMDGKLIPSNQRRASKVLRRARELIVAHKIMARSEGIEQ